MAPRSARPERILSLALVALAVGVLLVPVSAASDHPGPTAPPVAAAPKLGTVDPFVGRSSPGMPNFQISTLSRASATCPYSYPYTPAWLAYDSADSSFWVADASGCVDEISAPGAYGVGYNVTRTVAVGSTPFGVAVDNATDLVFVTNTGSNNVTVINGSSGAIVAWVPVGLHPRGIDFDPAANAVYVANTESGNVSVISAASLHVVASPQVGTWPVGVAVDRSDGAVFVANSGSSNVSVISDRTNRTVANVATGNGSYGVAWDPRADTVFVSNPASSNLSVLNGSTDGLVATIALAGLPNVQLQGLAFDPRNDTVWIGAGLWFAAVVNASSNTFQGFVSVDPAGVAVDPTSGVVCLTNTANNTFECLSERVVRGLTTPASELQFQESGLPAGLGWSVSANATSCSCNVTTQSNAGTNVTFGAFPGDQYHYLVPVVAGYGSTPSSGLVTPASTPIVNLTFQRLRGSFPVTFVEHGLPGGDLWNVTIANTSIESSAASLVDWLPNGTYAFQAWAPGPYVAARSLSVVVAGAAVNVTVEFNETFAVDFVEQGLPYPTEFSVNVTGYGLTYGVDLASFDLPNGSYRFSVPPVGRLHATPSPGTVVVAGSNTSVNLTFGLPTYPVDFDEFGLPAGTAWSVTVNGTALAGTSESLAGVETNGTYAYTVGVVPGFVPPAPGVVLVAGTPTTVTVAFTAFQYALTFRETGLPNGTGWAVAVGSEVASGVTANLQVLEPNGSFAYVVLDVAGYISSGSGLVVIRGGPALVNVSFVPAKFPVVFIALGLTAGSNWSVTAVDAATGYRAAQSSTTNAITLFLPNGTYNVTFSLPSGSSANVSSTQVTVAGHATPGVSIAVHGHSAAAASGVPAWEWGLVVAAVGVVAGVVGLLLGRRRSGGAAPPPPVG